MGNHQRKLALYLWTFLAVPTRIVLMNQIVHLDTVNRIVHTWTIMSLKSRYLSGFLKPGYGKKIIKDNLIQFMLSFNKIFINYQKIIQSDPYCPLKDSAWPILSSQGFFRSFHQKLVFYFQFKHLLKSLNQRQYGLTHTIALEKKIKTHMIHCWNFFNISRKFWPRGNTVSPLLSFQGFHILSFPGSNRNFNLKLIYLLVFKSFLKTHGQYGLTHIVLLRIL